MLCWGSVKQVGVVWMHSLALAIEARQQVDAPAMQVPVLSAPHLWWQHAAHAILAERTAALQSGLGRPLTVQQLQKRRMYTRLYMLQAGRIHR